ncbi:beta/gamma crystallin-related protein [Photobacterium sp. SKA34]|uniref:beta/gamma crystallin-related protein n=1 Tax=Photobacterium sp. SKA34 TaxID=121723 RepID=UPI0003089C02|nr:beta/gamma crystallin-related protein [Photobacterium sp. SKA34]
MKRILCLSLMISCVSPAFAAKHNNDEIYVCTLSPFTDTFADAARTEDAARYKVAQRCLKSQSDMFCRAQEANCFTTSLSANNDHNSHKSVKLFSKKNQKGHSIDISRDKPNFFDTDFNDKMVSFKIPSGWKVRFYEDINYQGKSYTYKGGKDNADGFEHAISSMKILKK